MAFDVANRLCAPVLHHYYAATALAPSLVKTLMWLRLLP
jgi:hypothetical protein